MTRAVAFVAAALLAATLGAAQNAPSSSTTNGNANMPPSASTNTPQSAPDSTTGSDSGTVTLTGCLSGSALTEGSFKLTDKNGTVYNLTGDQAELTSNVGHEVSVTGEVTRSSAASAGNANPNQNSSGEKEPATMRASGVTKISDHCQQGASGPAALVTGSGPATLMRVSMQSTDSTAKPAGAEMGRVHNADRNAAEEPTAPAAGNANLPTTATFLPLLGLLGLGSLVAGFLVRH
jgi:hypothetical protein